MTPIRAAATRTAATYAFAVASAAIPGALAAQTPGAPPAPTGTAPTGTTPAGATPRALPRDTVRRDSARLNGVGRDSVRRDSTRRDSTLFEFTPEDSIMKALRARRNYDAVRYQGDTVRFGARERALILRGRPSAVQRDNAILVGPRVRYDDSTQVVTASVDSAGRDSVILRDPSQGSDVVVRREVRYNLAERRGVVQGFSTSATQGETWYVMGGRGAFAAADSATTPNVPKGAEGQRVFYAHDAGVTSCNEEKPHYHFQARDVKMVSKRLLVIRPATLYIGDVPVLWLPFVYQDTRPGRRSGLLRPTFGPAELLRNSPTYQRSVRHFGYYTNLGDYADAEVWFDYRSGARPGNIYSFGEFTSNGQLRYKSIERQLSGNLAIGHTSLTNGQSGITLSLDHQQQWTVDRRLSAAINLVQNTTIQRINTFDVNQSLARISSNASYSDRFGPVSAALSASTHQQSGRPDFSLSFPNLTLNSRTISVTPWFDWTPTLSVTNQQDFRVSALTAYGYVYTRNAAGNLDSVRVNASQRATNIAFNTPIKVFGFSIGLPVSFNESVTNAPTPLTVYGNVNDTTTRQTRVFNQTFTSNFDVNPSISLPAFFQGTWNISPTVNLANVDQGGLLYRSQYSGGRFVSGNKRLQYGLTAAPTLYAFFPGIGPIERFRNSINPSFSYTYSPTANVSDEYLRAIGVSRQGYLGALKQNSFTLGFTTSLEAKMRARRESPVTPGPRAEVGVQSTGQSSGASPTNPLPTDSAARADAANGPPIANAGIISTSGGSANAEQRKLKIATIQFSSLTYDIVRKDTTGRGLTNSTFSYTLTSDLLPSFRITNDYSLYLGDPTSDTARFKPYRTGTSVSFTLDRNSGLFGTLSKLFGLNRGGNSAPVPSPTQNAPGDVAGGDPEFARQAAAARVAGSGAYDARNAPVPQNFSLSLTYSLQRQRPDIVGGIPITDFSSQCSAYLSSGDFAYQQCLYQARQNPLGNATQLGSAVRGAPIYLTPPVQSINASTSFHITQKWGVNWSTNYDVQRNQFASNTVSLQRELHDWRANFNFTQGVNGNFAFYFSIALKAEPDVKFDYNRSTTRSAYP